MNAPRPRVTVVDDHSLFAESLVIALQGQGVVAQAVVPNGSMMSPAQLERALLQRRPDLALSDLDLGGAFDGMRLVPALTSAGVAVVVITGSADPARMGQALSHGALVVLSKAAPFSVIIETVRRIRDGLPVMSRQERQRLLDAWRESAGADRELRRRFDQITRREGEVLGLLMDGRQVSEIARGRFVSESTVRTQVKSVLAKLQVSSQLSAVGLAHRLGWRPPGDHPTSRPARPTTLEDSEPRAVTG
jgi:two-component system nitrate/nitrite response regulator NarL